MNSPKLVETVRVGNVHYQKMQDGTLSPLKSRTDWQQLDVMTDAQVESAALSDPDSLPYTDEQWAGGKLSDPFKTPVTIRLDTEVVDWFKNQGSRYQTRINAVLRRYVEAQRKTG